MATDKTLKFVGRLIDDESKTGKKYTYLSVEFVKDTGEIVPVKRVFLSDLEMDYIKLLMSK